MSMQKLVDLEVKMFGTNIAHLFANTRRGRAWLTQWASDEDPPTKMRDGRIGVVVTKDDLHSTLEDAMRAGLSL
jgi:hypothetical protein